MRNIQTTPNIQNEQKKSAPLILPATALRKHMRRALTHVLRGGIVIIQRHSESIAVIMPSKGEDAIGQPSKVVAVSELRQNLRKMLDYILRGGCLVIQRHKETIGLMIPAGNDEIM